MKCLTDGGHCHGDVVNCHRALLVPPTEATDLRRGPLSQEAVRPQQRRADDKNESDRFISAREAGCEAFGVSFPQTPINKPFWKRASGFAVG